GGFFSNIGVVRKQLLNGGSLLGFGVFWDYDGDQNQYEDQLIGDVDAMTFAGGYSYNQVGISGELLTDWGNIRSNGYIPVGTTGQSTGKYVSRNILCMQGINAALGGADFELGAYLPGLSDWAGVINVGGYAYGNTRYQLDNGADLVPWFGGVYTRLDMTFADNWDFSLQYNNDSYFDSTGFARLTYRLGGSRRRNVPDQMEQPMMRNEHIVRAHQNAMVCINPETGQPWRIIHVDNETTSPATGNGSIVNPVASLGGTDIPPGGGQNPTAETVATQPYDIIFVHSSSIAYTNAPAISNPPGVFPILDPTIPTNLNMFTLQNSNQYLVGEGSSLRVPTMDGSVLVSTTVNPALYPTLSPNPNNSAVFIPPAIPATAVAPPAVSPPLTGGSIDGFNVTASGTGIHAAATSGLVTLGDLNIRGGEIGLLVEGNARYDVLEGVTFEGQNGTGLENNGGGTMQLAGSTFTNIRGTAIETNGGTLTANQITIEDTEGNGIIVGGDASTKFTMNSSTVTGSREAGIVDNGDGSLEIIASRIDGSGTAGFRTRVGANGSANFYMTSIDGDDPRTTDTEQSTVAGIQMEGNTGVALTSFMDDENPVTVLEAGVTRGNLIRNSQDGVVVTGNGQFSMSNGLIVNIDDIGIDLRPTSPTDPLHGSAALDSTIISDIGAIGIRAQGSGSTGGSSVSLTNGSRISTVGDLTAGTGVGILATNIGDTVTGGGASILLDRSSVQIVGEAGIRVANTNLRVQNNSRIVSTGSFGIDSRSSSTAWIFGSRISDVTVGIEASAPNGLSFAGGVTTGLFNDITIRENTIQADTNGISLVGAISTIAGATDADPRTITSQGIVDGNIRQNNITAATPITLTTTGGIIGTPAGTETVVLDPGPPAVTVQRPVEPLPPNVTGGINGATQGLRIAATDQANLSNLNNGAAVTEIPTPVDPIDITTSVDYQPLLVPTEPPLP
ncbi:MAG: right-handed parallel beta-helix repeat-containing protein, partial [Pirellulales bacterium]